jgi:hypothetical protein
VLNVAGQTITANPTGGFVVGGQTLAPNGAAITISGTPISLASGGSAIVVGSSTVPIANSGGKPAVLTVGAQTITANSAGTFVIGGQTLTPGGPAITISGTRVSLAAGATDVVIGTSTLPIGVGGYILNAMGGPATNTAAANGYNGPIANEAGRVDWRWSGLLMGVYWVVRLAFGWVG